MWAYIHYGFRQFLSRGDDRSSRRLLGAALSIGLSLLPLIASIEVTDGMIDGITRRYLEVGTYHMQAHRFGTVEEDQLSQALDVLDNIDEVELAFETRQGLGLAYSPEGRAGVIIRSIPDNMYTRDTGMHTYLTINSGQFDFAGGGAVLSAELASIMDVGPGDQIKLLTPRTLREGRFVIRQSSFIVNGVFTSGYQELDALMMYISEEQGRVLLQESGASYIGIKIRDPYVKLERTRRNIAGELPEKWYVYTWQELEEAMYKGFKTTRNLLMFVMVLIVIVAAVNVSSSVFMLAVERSGDIAILKSTGASSAGITASFVFIALCVGLLGSLVGTILGLIVSVNINEIIRGVEWIINFFASPFGSEEIRILNPGFYLEKIPVDIRFREVFSVALLAPALAVLSAYIPARRAGRLRPVEILNRR